MNRTVDNAPDAGALELPRAIQRLCAERGARLTPMRRAVYRALHRHDGALSAYALIEVLTGSLGRRPRPPSVYRALEFWMGQGLVHRVFTLGAFCVCRHPGEVHEPVLLVCEHCGGVTEISAADVDDALFARARGLDFELRAQAVELLGTCRDCAGG